MNDTYVMSRPGRPLHLAVWAHQPGDPHSGRSVPLCRQDRGRRWQITGRWAAKWEQHSRSGVCSRCETALDELNAEWAVLDR